MARYLIVLRCGRDSLHRQWLDNGGRNWDLILCPYQDVETHGFESHPIPGQKWTGLYRFLTEQTAWRNYDYICLPDDDISASCGTWNLFFDLCGKYDISLAAPALTPDSYFSFGITLQNTEFLARRTSFVEVMTPCFSRRFLEAALPTLALSRSGSGFGLDCLWAYILAYKNMWIIDQTTVRHTRPVGISKDEVLRSLARYDLERIKGFGIPEPLSTLAGIDLSGRLSQSTDAGFNSRLRRGYSYLEQKDPLYWRMIASDVPAAPPEINQGAVNRLMQSLAHIVAPDQTISRGRKCLTSSVSQWSWCQDPALAATGANDGILNGVFGFHTDLEVNPWWQIDLGRVYGITSVVIYNRLDMRDRFVDFDILSSLDNRAWIAAFSKRDGRTFGGLDGAPLQLTFSPPLRARFVRIQLAGENFLHLDQVEIFGGVSQIEDKDISVDSPQPVDLVADSVMMFERLLSDPRGRFLLKREIAGLIESERSPLAEADLFALFGMNHLANDGADLTRVERLAAAIDSSNFLNSEMRGCHRYGDSFELLTAGMRSRSVQDGLVLEFGVFSGKSINHLASLDTGPVFGFDSFEGLPEDWRPDMPKAAFKLSEPPAVARNVELVIGWFETTLPDFVAANAGPVSFLHIDCDLYSSTKTVFHHLRDRIVSGTVIIFDEYFNYVGWRNHEYKAFAEFVAEMGLRYRYFGAVPAHQQAGVMIC